MTFLEHLKFLCLSPLGSEFGSNLKERYNSLKKKGLEGVLQNWYINPFRCLFALWVYGS